MLSVPASPRLRLIFHVPLVIFLVLGRSSARVSHPARFGMDLGLRQLSVLEFFYIGFYPVCGVWLALSGVCQEIGLETTIGVNEQLSNDS